MKEHEHYQQPPLALDAQPGEIAPPKPSDERSLSTKHVLSFAVTGSGAPLVGDFTQEYAFELATRKRLGLPELSPGEFRQIRSWRDGIAEDEP